MTAVSFTTIAQPNPGGVLFVEIPEKVVAKLGAGKRVPVRVTLNGAKYRSTIAVYGEIVESVASAKRAETRAIRISKVIAQVRAKARPVSPK